MVDCTLVPYQDNNSSEVLQTTSPTLDAGTAPDGMVLLPHSGSTTVYEQVVDVIGSDSTEIVLYFPNGLFVEQNVEETLTRHHNQLVELCNAYPATVPADQELDSETSLQYTEGVIAIEWCMLAANCTDPTPVPFAAGNMAFRGSESKAFYDKIVIDWVSFISFGCLKSLPFEIDDADTTVTMKLTRTDNFTSSTPVYFAGLGASEPGNVWQQNPSVTLLDPVDGNLSPPIRPADDDLGIEVGIEFAASGGSFIEEGCEGLPPATGDPELSIADVAANEDDGTVTVSVILSEASNQTIEVDWITRDGTAVDPDDYLFASGTSTFTPGSTLQTFDITLVDNGVVDGELYFYADLSNPINATIADGEGTITIGDDEGGGTPPPDIPDSPVCPTITLGSPNTTVYEADDDVSFPSLVGGTSSTTSDEVTVTINMTNALGIVSSTVTVGTVTETWVQSTQVYTLVGPVADVNQVLSGVQYESSATDKGTIPFYARITDADGNTRATCSFDAKFTDSGATVEGREACTGDLTLSGTAGDMMLHVLNTQSTEIVELFTAAIPFNTDIPTTVTDMINAINANNTTPKFTANPTIADSFEVCSPLGIGASANGWTVQVKTSSGDLLLNGTTDAMEGGADQDDETKKNEPEFGDSLWAKFGTGLVQGVLTTVINDKLAPKTRVEVPTTGDTPVRDIRYYYQGNTQVPVPDVYDPVARTMSGPWDYTTLKYVYTDNPAWCALEHLQDEEWGLGQRVYANMNAAQRIQLHTDLFDISERCDEVVNGETRYTINALLTSNRTPLEQLEDICGIFHGRPVWEPRNKLRIIQDKVKDPKLIVNYTSVLDDGFDYNSSSSNAVSDTILVDWYDPDRWSSKTTESVDVTIPAATPSPSTRTIDAWGADNNVQAVMHGRKVLLDDASNPRTVNYTSTMDHDDIIPGDVVRILDPWDATNITSGDKIAGRVTSTLALDEIIIDRDPAGTVGKSIYIMMDDGTTHSTTVASIDSGLKKVFLTGAMPSTPVNDAKYNISDGKLFMVIKITPRLPSGYEVVGIEYNPAKWTTIDAAIT